MFPPEIIDAIVDNFSLPADGAFDETMTLLPTLLACSLTSRSFAAAARRRLYSTVTIGLFKRKVAPNFIEGRMESAMGPRIQSLIDLLGEDVNSDLATMVRTLEINVDQGGRTFAPEIDTLLTLLSQRAVGMNTLFIHTQIEEFSWTQIPQGTAQLLADLCAVLPVSVLKFASVVDIPSSLTTRNICPRLTTLDIRNVSFSNDSTKLVTSRGSLAGLSNLAPQLFTGTYRVEYGIDGESLITSMDVVIMHAKQVDQLSVLLISASETLELFGCFVTDRLPQILPRIALDLGQMKKLRKFSVQRSTSHENVESVIAQISGLLAHGNKSSALERVDFALHSTIGYDRVRDFTQFDYTALRCLLLDVLRENHPLIQHVRLAFLIDCVPSRYPRPTPAQLRDLEDLISTHVSNAITTSVSGNPSPVVSSLPDLRVRIRYRNH